MNFPKPTASVATIKAYSARVAQLQKRYQRIHGAGGNLEQFVHATIARKSELSRATWRQYKAALLCCLRHLRGRTPLSDIRIRAVDAAIHQLEAESSAGCRKRGVGTSARKAKKIDESDIETLRRYFTAKQIEYAKQAKHAKHRLAGKASAMMELLRLTGMRPCEAATATYAWLSASDVRIVIANAKHSNGRGNGSHRTITLSGLDPDETRALREVGLGDSETGDDGQRGVAVTPKQLGRYWGYAVRQALSKRAVYPCLYTFRHQFTADAKKTGLSTEEVAALLGHHSDATATTHYGKTIRGRGGLKASASKPEVATVLRKANTFPGPSSSFTP